MIARPPSNLAAAVFRGFGWALAQPIRRPRLALCVAALLAALAAWSVGRLRPDPSIESMLARNDPAAKALVRVLNGFGASEELLLLVSVAPDDPDPESAPARLLAFAGRLEKAVAASPEASAMADGIAYRADPEIRRFFELVLVPNGLFYLDDASFREARERLTRAGMRRQVARTEAALAQPGPAAQAAAKVMAQDPLRLFEFVTDRLSAGRAFRTWRGGEEFISPDGKSLLVRVAGRRPPTDMDFTKAFVAAMERAVASAGPRGLAVRYAGSYAIAAESERAIRRDMTSSIVSSVLCMAGLFLLVQRGPLRFFHLALLPVALGVLYGLGLYGLFARTLNPLTGVVGAMLAGMGIDYSVHFLSDYERRRASGLRPARAAAAVGSEIGPALFAACLTSVIGFAAVGWSSLAALRDFAGLGTLGLVGSFLCAVLVLPALLCAFAPKTDAVDAVDAADPEQDSIAATQRVAREPGHHAGPSKRIGPRLDPAPFVRAVGRRARLLLGASIVLTAGAAAAVALAPGELVPLEQDLTVMHPRPNPALDAQTEIGQRFGTVAGGGLVVHLRADGPESLVALAHRVQDRLAAPAARAGGVVGTFGLATLLPDPALAPARRTAASAAEAERVAADFKSVIADSSLDAARFGPYADFLRTLLTPREPPGVNELLPFRSLARLVLPDEALRADSLAVATEAITLVFLDPAAETRAGRDAAVAAGRAAVAGLPGATVTGMPVLSHDAESTVRRDLPRVLGVASLLVAAYMLAHFRSVRDTLLALLPAAFSLLCVAAVMRLSGQRLNMVNLVALPLLLGMDVDYGIFVVSLARGTRTASADELAGRIAASCHAVVLCAATTVLGFGSLAFTSVPAIRSLGVVVAVGVIACLYGTLLFLVPLIYVLRGRGGAVEDGAARETSAARLLET